ncbi:hypothetical protein [Burkholderia gladioli]|uniref:hypothetical protein n=1 Tax=Burkholderia gladioli TaxID=28095 RepID=UPI0015E76F45|nr:hypothetical protein [Burkholderia gladioli]MBA1366229.1 hypothetical protein [Burkholderia gladioli]
MKPRIKPLRRSDDVLVWICKCDRIWGAGKTPEEAYERWRLNLADLPSLAVFTRNFLRGL